MSDAASIGTAELLEQTWRDQEQRNGNERPSVDAIVDEQRTKVVDSAVSRSQDW